MSFSLHECAWNDHIFAIKEFLKHPDSKSHINDPDVEWGCRTPLHIAANRGHVNCCNLLLQHGADTSARMSQAWTPAHCAAENGHKAVLKALYEHSADMRLLDENGDSPSTIAAMYGHTGCVEYLKSLETIAPLVPVARRTRQRKRQRSSLRP